MELINHTTNPCCLCSNSLGVLGVSHTYLPHYQNVVPMDENTELCIQYERPQMGVQGIFLSILIIPTKDNHNMVELGPHKYIGITIIPTHQKNLKYNFMLNTQGLPPLTLYPHMYSHTPP